VRRACRSPSPVVSVRPSCVGFTVRRRVGAPSCPFALRACVRRCVGWYAVVSVRRLCVGWFVPFVRVPCVRRRVRCRVCACALPFVGWCRCVVRRCAVSVRSLSLRVRLPASPCRACAPFARRAPCRVVRVRPSCSSCVAVCRRAVPLVVRDAHGRHGCARRVPVVPCLSSCRVPVVPCPRRREPCRCARLSRPSVRRAVRRVGAPPSCVSVARHD